ncbi:MAG TPA: MATE family efflux transporter [Pseudoflavonifractor capillosus]|uniref:Probable multidrug resistance protein NorM n=2 Tax=Pseudoflavonifractor capillosus TaxID=106588 RepID=A0A921SSK2_9FIRM|nr:MATE family efflux transporter [Pseudoflavonifractor capillosus]HJG86274.1 MATE family efflux transporter [Pseudoflavonifractor capillosus]
MEPMTSGSIWKRMILFALPLMLGNLFQQMYNTVDSLIVGRFVGSSALAAVSSSGSLIGMLIGLLSGISSGAGVIVARHFGAGDREGLHRTVHTIVAFGLAAGVVMTAVGVLLSPQILMWMGTPESVMAESVTYLRIYFCGSLAVMMYNVFVGILQAVGDGRHPLYYLIASSVVNLGLDLLFIQAFDAGVGGAALATVISQVVSALLCLIQLIRTKEDYRLELRSIRFERDILGQIVRVGLPSGVQNSIIAFANVIVQSNVNAFGEMAMAGYGAYAKIEGFGFLPINSFTLALTTFVGQNLGATQYERTKKGARFGILMTVTLAEAIGVLVFLFAPQLIALFDPTPEVVAFGVGKARTAALFYCLLAYAHSVAAVLRGAGKAVIPMAIMIAIWCGVRVAFLSITIPLTHSIQMVYWVYPLTWGISCVLFFLYYKKADWMHARM